MLKLRPVKRKADEEGPPSKSQKGMPLQIELKDGTNVLGRDEEEVDVFLCSPTNKLMISRRMCTIKRTSGSTKARPEASVVCTLTAHGMNGVFVNNRKVTRATLVEGDVVTFGGAPASVKPDQVVSVLKSDLVYVFTIPPSEKKNEPAKEEPKLLPCGCKENDCKCTAAKPKSAATSQKISEELQCCICRELMARPHALRCSHTFCKDCITDWLGRAPKGTGTCPSCRETVKSDPVPVRALDNTIDIIAKTHLTLEELAERQQRIKELDAPKPSPAPPAKKARRGGSTARRGARGALRGRGRAAPRRETHHDDDSESSDADFNSEEDDSDDDDDDYDDDEDDDDDEHGSTFSVEYARSGRAMCRSCGGSIALNALRWVEHRNDSYYQSQQYHHLRCRRPLALFDGNVRHLAPADRTKVRKKMAGTLR
eukprot:m.165781 g.165781  ORF g.165781 m.165781 type:complete len:427 (+) comp24986_c0_seq5:38-1318(+)